MKYCPTCDARYDDEVMRFCTKDGSPLIDEAEPNFTAPPAEDMPDQAVPVTDEDDEGELTVVRRNIPVPPPAFDDDDFSDGGQRRQPERIVVPMERESPADPIRNRTSAVYY